MDRVLNMFWNSKIQQFIKTKKVLSGLTLVELLVSLSIITLVTAIFVTNYQTTNKRTDLIMAAQVLVADIHRAQNNSLGLIKYGDMVPAGGWGISFDRNRNKSQYILFADLDRPGTARYRHLDANEHDIDKGGRVVDLPPLIEIHAIRFDSQGTGQLDSVNLTFLPPDPQINIFSNGATSTILEIDLRETRNNTIKTIRVNFLGLAEVIN